MGDIICFNDNGRITVSYRERCSHSGNWESIAKKDITEDVQKITSSEISQLRVENERLRGEEWISVSERLPEKEVAVYVFSSDGVMDSRALGYCDDDPNGLWYCVKGQDEPLRFNDVVLWHPLPDKPGK